MLKNEELIIELDGETFSPKEADTLRKKQAAMKALRKEYLKENGLTGIRRALLAEKGGFYENAVSAHSDLMTQYTEADTIEQWFKDTEEARDTFINANHASEEVSSFNDLYQSLRLTGDPKTKKPLTNQQALEKTIEIIEEQMDVGEFKQEDLDAMGNQVITDPLTGQKIKVKDKWPTRFKKLQEELIEADGENFDISEKKRENAFNDDIQTLREASSEMPPEKLTSEYWRTEHGKLKRKHPGFQSDWLDANIKNAADGEDYDTQLGQAEDLRNKGLLTTATLKTFDWKIQKRFAEDAKFLDKALSKENSVHVKELEEIVSYTFTTSGLEKNHPSVGPMTEAVLAHYRKNLAAAIQADVPNPSLVASENTKIWFKAFAENPKNFDLETGYKIPDMPTKKEIRQTVRNIKKEVLRQKELIDKYKEKIVSPAHINKLISKEKLVESLETFYKQDGNAVTFDYPGEIDALYEMVGTKGMSKFDLMNAALEASGLPNLGEKPPSIEKLDNNTSKGDNITLSNKTQNTSARVWASIARNTDSLNIEIVPNGEELYEYTEGLGIDFASAATAMELLQTNPSIAAHYDLQPEDIEPGKINWERLHLALNSLVGKISGHDLRPLEEQEAGLEAQADQVNTAVTTLLESIGGVGRDLSPLEDQMAELDLENQQNRAALDSFFESIPTGHDVRPLDEQMAEMDQNTQEFKNWWAGLINSAVNAMIGDAPEFDENQTREVAISKYKTTGNIQDAPLRQ